MEIAKAFVGLYFDASKGVQQAEKETQALGSKLSGTLLKFFGAAAFGAAMKSSIDAASDLNETVSKTNVIFGASGVAIEQWATNSAQQFGLSKKSALDAASTFAVFGKGAGLAGEDLTGFSEKLVGLSADLASFYNTSPEQAIGAIGAALRGESEPIRAYGVLLDDATLKQQAMTMGLYSGKGALDQHSRVLAAQAVILKQTSDAQGDFARTADGLANSQRIAKAEAENASASLGASFLPVYKTAVQIVGALATAFGELSKPVQVVIVALIALVALSGPIGTVIDIVKDVGKGLAGMANGAGLAGSALGILSVAVVAYIYVSDRMAAGQERSAAYTKSVTEALSGEVDQLVKTRKAAGEFVDTVGTASDAQSAFNKALGAGDNGKKLQAALGALGFTISDTSKVLGDLKTNTEGWISQQLQARGATTSTANEIARVINVYDDWDNSINRLTDSQAAGGNRIKQFAEAAHISEEEATKLVHSLANLDDVSSETHVDQISSSFLNNAAAADQNGAALVRMAEDLTGTTRNADDSYKVFQAYLGLLENGTGHIQTITAAQEELNKSAQGGAAASKDVASAADTEAQAKKDAATATDTFKKAQERSNAELDKAIKKLEDEAAALLDQITAARDAADSTYALRDSTDSYHAYLAELDKKIGEAKGNQDALNAVYREGTTDAASIADATVRVFDETARAAGTALTATEKQDLWNQSMLTTVATQSGPLRQSTLDYIAAVNGIPPDKATYIQALIDQGKLDEANKLLADASTTRHTAIVADADTAQAERDLTNLARNRFARIVAAAGTSPYSLNDAVHNNASGRFVPGGTNMLSTLGENAGRSGDEVVLPLGNRGRLQTLLSDSRVGSRVAAALGSTGSTSTTTVHLFEGATIESDVDFDGAMSSVNFHLASMGVG